nr:MAG TPA: hypothetical protein [Bacteriophage sp.]
MNRGSSPIFRTKKKGPGTQVPGPFLYALPQF